jgi:hypothetical protein
VKLSSFPDFKQNYWIRRIGLLGGITTLSMNILSITVLGIMTLSMKGLYVKFSSIPDFKQNYWIRRIGMLGGIMTLSMMIRSITMLSIMTLSMKG